MKFKRILGIALAALLSATPMTACKKKTQIKTAYPDKKVGFQLEKPEKGEKIAIMHTSMGDIKIRFFPEGAPKAVENFTTHAKNGYYNGVIFHRVINDFMIQSGDPEGTGRGGESIWGGKFEDEFDGKLLNLRGSLAMANAGPGTNGSQFFINQSPPENFNRDNYDPEKIKEHYKEYYYEPNKLAYAQQYGYKSFEEFYKANQPELNLDPKLVPDEVWEIYEKTGGNISLDGAWSIKGGHTVFGQVFEGMDVVDAIAAVETAADDKPKNEVKIINIEIVDYKG